MINCAKNQFPFITSGANQCMSVSCFTLSLSLKEQDCERWTKGDYSVSKVHLLLKKKQTKQKQNKNTKRFGRSLI